jgi:DNA-binding transcriptional ArsR family regulator
MEISVAGKYAAARAGDAELGAIFTALADPTRRALVAALRERDATVSELASGFAIGIPAISKHLTVLEGAGLISRHRVAQWRRCRLEAQAFERLNEWMSHYSSLWEGSLDRLDDYLQRVTPQEADAEAAE